VPAELDFTASDDATSTQKTVSAGYATVNGDAKAPGDFTAPVVNSKVTFAPGETTKNIPITIVNDNVYELTETFTVKLSGPAPAGVTLGTDIATVTINDDDSTRKPTFSVTNAPFTEGAAGGKGVFTVNLSYASTQPVTFDVAIADDTATHGGNNIGPGSNDYTAPPMTVTVPAGSSSATIEVPVIDDSVYEGTTAEKATLTVSLAQGETDATGPSASGELQITDNDSKPTFALTASSGTEGSDVKVVATVTGTTQYDVPFDITLDGDNAEGNNPAEDSDYTDNGVTGTIPGGTLTGKVLNLGTVTLNQDQIDEPAEFFRITATDPDDADRYVSALYRINDDPSDLPPVIAIDDVTTIDEDEGTVDAHVRLSFEDGNDATSTEQVLSAGWKTGDGTARAGYDYTAKTGTLTFQPGVTDLSANVPIVNDTVDEPTQTFTVTLSDALPKGVMITAAMGEVQIMDNDATAGPTLNAPVSRVGAGPVPVSGNAAEGAQVRIYAAAPSTPTKWFLAATATANAYGIYTASLPFDMGYYLQARVGSATSPTKLVKVVEVPVLTVTSTIAGQVNFTVAGNPKLAGLGVTVQRKNANGTWTTVATGLTGGTAKTYVAALKGQRSGTTMTFKAVIAANATWGTLAGTSAERAVRVR
jgi:Calx-beta domain-containing protein